MNLFMYHIAVSRRVEIRSREVQQPNLDGCAQLHILLVFDWEIRGLPFEVYVTRFSLNIIIRYTHDWC